MILPLEIFNDGAKSLNDTTLYMIPITVNQGSNVEDILQEFNLRFREIRQREHPHEIFACMVED